MTITRCSIRTKNQFTNLYLKNSHHSLTLRTTKKLHKRKKTPHQAISPPFYKYQNFSSQQNRPNTSITRLNKQTNKQNYFKKKKKKEPAFSGEPSSKSSNTYSPTSYSSPGGSSSLKPITRHVIIINSRTDTNNLLEQTY